MRENDEREWVKGLRNKYYKSTKGGDTINKTKAVKIADDRTTQKYTLC